MRRSRESSRFLENHTEVAASFDPSGTALISFTLASDGKPQRTVQSGDMIEVPDMDGKSVRVAVEEISSWGDDKAMLAISRIGVCIWPEALDCPDLQLDSFQRESGRDAAIEKLT